MEMLAPFRLRPWFRTRVWGVRNLAPWYDYTVGEEPIGEVWLSGDDCVVDSGPLKDTRFDTLYKEHGPALVGEEAAREERFPLLMKVLFPQEKLSVQVHPGDEMAREQGEPHGKTECWYALEAEPGAAVALGLRSGATVERVKAAIESHTLEDLLQWVPVERGDMIFVEAGTVHAVGPGVVLLETQQSSDMTYRLYDYGRPRELHLENGLKATRVQTSAGKVPRRSEQGRTCLVESKYFAVDRIEIAVGMPGGFSRVAGRVELIFAASGRGRLESAGAEPVPLKKGELAVVPACWGEWHFRAEEPAEVLRAVPNS